MMRLIKQLFQVPITDAKQVAELLQVSPSTANRLIKDLIELKIFIILLILFMTKKIRQLR